MQARSARKKALGFGIILAIYQAHELIHHVAMKPWRPEGVFGDQPPRRKDGEVYIGRAMKVRRRSQYRKNRRIGMVEAHCVDAVEAGHIVLVGRIVAMPRDHVERRMVEA